MLRELAGAAQPGRGRLGRRAAAGRGAGRPRRRDARGLRRGRRELPAARLRARAGGADPGARGCIRCSSARRGPARASPTSSRASPSCCPRPRATRRPALRHRVQDRARAGGREGRLRPHVLRRGADARPAAGDGKVTAISVFDDGAFVRRDAVAAGEIGKLWGLAGVRIGDAIGEAHGANGRAFAPPTLETVVVPGDATDRRALRVALDQLAEQDPLIDVRQDGGELSRLALRRGAEGGHPGDAGGRLRRRRLVPRVDHDLHRAAAGGGAAFELIGERLQPVPRHRRPARRARRRPAAASRSGSRSSSARCRRRSSRRSRRRCRRR